MSRSITEVNTSGGAKWIKTRVKAERRYRHLGSKGMRQELKMEEKSLASRCYWSLSELVIIGSDLCDKIHEIKSKKYSWAASAAVRSDSRAIT